MTVQRIVVAWAVRYGILEAILLDVLVELLAAREDCYEFEGKRWLQLSLRELQAQMPYVSTYRIRTALELLISEKLVVSRESEQKLGVKKRRVMSYALTEKGTHLVDGLD